MKVCNCLQLSNRNDFGADAHSEPAVAIHLT